MFVETWSLFKYLTDWHGEELVFSGLLDPNVAGIMEIFKERNC